MTREEAISSLITIKMLFDNRYAYEALDMAIEALSTDAVPPSLAGVYKWERDIALSQLEEYGIGFAEKKRDDLVEVVRCKDCKYWEVGTNGTWTACTYWSGDPYEQANTEGNDFCSYGERREP